MPYEPRHERALVDEVVKILRRCGFATRRPGGDNFRLHGDATSFLDRNELEWPDWYALCGLAHEQIRAGA